MKEVQRLGDQLAEKVKSLAEKYPSFSEKAILLVLKHAWNGSKVVGRGVACSFRLVDGVFDIGRAGFSIGRAGAVGARAAVSALGIVAL